MSLSFASCEEKERAILYRFGRIAQFHCRSYCKHSHRRRQANHFYAFFFSIFELRGIRKHLMADPSGNSEFCFPSALNVPLGFASGNIEGLRGNKTHCFPWGQPLSAY